MKTLPIHFLSACLVGLLANAAHTQAASWRILDAKQDGLAQTHTLRALPRLGSTFEIQTDEPFVGSHRGLPLVITGSSNVVFSGGRLPVDLSFTSQVGRDYRAAFGTLKCSPDVILPSSGVFGMAIPNDPALIGLRFYQQTMMVVSGSSYGGGNSITLSFGSLAEVTVGR